VAQLERDIEILRHDLTVEKEKLEKTDKVYREKIQTRDEDEIKRFKQLHNEADLAKDRMRDTYAKELRSSTEKADQARMEFVTEDAKKTSELKRLRADIQKQKDLVTDKASIIRSLVIFQDDILLMSGQQAAKKAMSDTKLVELLNKVSNWRRLCVPLAKGYERARLRAKELYDAMYAIEMQDRDNWNKYSASIMEQGPEDFESMFEGVNLEELGIPENVGDWDRM
jgi:hypothetical protein